MDKKIILVGSLLLMLIITACTSTDAAVGTGETKDAQAGDPQPAAPRLDEDYEDALSVQAQLAVGTLRLEDTEVAVDETSAAELLPLWQALQSLNNSDTAAAAEINAVVNQIQETMSAEQISQIKGMALTTEGLTAMIEDGTLSLRGGGRFGAVDNGGGSGFSGGFPEGGFPEGGFIVGGGPRGAGEGGGRAGGFIVGGGPEGGFEGGPGGFGGSNLSEDDIATRRAQFAGGDGLGAIQDNFMIGAVIRLLEVKTGEAVEVPNIFSVVFDIVSQETGLSAADIRAQMSENTTLAEIVEASGGDVDAVHDALVTALKELPNMEGQDVEQIVSDWLGQGSGD